MTFGAVRQPDPAEGLSPSAGSSLPAAQESTPTTIEFEEPRARQGWPVARVSSTVSSPIRYLRRQSKLDELKGNTAGSAEVLLVDASSPSQQRLLENTLEARVVDRTQLIPTSSRSTRPARRGLRSSSRSSGTTSRACAACGSTSSASERSAPGAPGESQLESDRRIARQRVSLLKDRLEELSKQRDVRRKERRRTQTPTVALAGYTNVGKSTLLNALTDADVSVRNRLFETLDPTTRGFEHEGRKYLVTDTVGFVRRLPHQLVEGFAATLEETLVADLVLHVIDASAPEERLVEMIAAVNGVLHDIGADELPIELVLNKVDAADETRRRALSNRYPDAVQVSALTGEGLDELRARIAERFADLYEPVRLLLPYQDGGKLNELYALGAPIEAREDTSEGVLVIARLPRREINRFARYLVGA
jgi:GTP-binding protein HflX